MINEEYIMLCNEKYIVYRTFYNEKYIFGQFDSLEEAIKKSILLQPAVIDVSVKLNRNLIEKCSGVMGYTSLTGEMLSIKLTTKIKEKTITTCI